MIETAPKYIVEFKNELKEDIKKLEKTLVGRMGKMDVKINEIIEKQDVHFEAIGELKVQVTGIELSLKDKASHKYAKEIEKRTEKLEKVVFT